MPNAGVYVQYVLDRTSGKCADYQAIQPTPNPASSTTNGLSGVSCASASACTAVGYYDTASSADLTLAEAWNGTSWAIQPTPLPAGATSSRLSGVSCASASACTAVGYYATASSGGLTLAETWNGTSWTIQPTPNPAGATGSDLFSVSCASASACTAVGRYVSGSSGDFLTLAETWNGTSWTIQPTPNPAGATVSDLFSVSCASASACTAVGSGNGTLAEIWNGARWAIQPTSLPAGASGGELLSVSCASVSACTAVGFTQGSTGQPTLAEAWNGTKWTIKPTPSPAGRDFLESVPAPPPARAPPPR